MLSRPLILRLISGLILFITLFLFISIWLFGLQFAEKIALKQLQETTRAVVNDLNHQLLSNAETLAGRIAADSRTVATCLGQMEADNVAIKNLLSGVKLGADASIVYLMDSAGTVVACSPYEANETLTGNSYPFRPYFQDAMKGNAVIYPALGVTTGRRGFYFSTPIISPDRKTIGVVVIKQELHAFDSILINAPSPSAMVSPEGVIFSARDSSLHFKTIRPLSSDTLLQFSETKQFATQDLDPWPMQEVNGHYWLEGKKQLFYSHELAMCGWKLAVWKPLMIPYLALTLLSLLSLLIGSLFWICFYTLSHRNRARRSMKVALAALKQSHTQLTDILDHAPFGVIIIGLDHKIRWVNAQTCRLLGESNPEKLIHRNCKEFLCYDTEACDVIDKGLTCISKEEFFKTATGREIPILKSVVRTSINNEEVLLETIIDISEYRQEKDMLEQIKKMESLGHLSAGIAHEIDTPIHVVGETTAKLREDFYTLLNVVKEYQKFIGLCADIPSLETRLIEQREKLNQADLSRLEDDIPMQLTQTRSVVVQVITLVEAIKEFAQPDPEKMGAFDLNACIRNTVTLTRSEWKERAQLELHLAEKLPLAIGYAGEMNQVILHFLINAIHAIEESIAQGLQQKGLLIISTQAINDGIEIRIKDSGIGISNEAKVHIFDPFFTTKAAGKGSGQGLTLAKHCIVQRHQGTLSFETIPRIGTTFIIWIPAQKSSTPPVSTT
jgi:PAS domain S-box-containing protein